MSEDRAAGSPAARLFDQAILEAQTLDEHRRRLAVDNPELGDLLLGLEEDALREMVDQVRSNVAGTSFLAMPPQVPGIRHRIRHGIGRMGPRQKSGGRRRGQARAPQIVKGSVVYDEPATKASGTTPNTPEDPQEPP